MQVDGQKARKADESAEADGVEEGEPVHGRLPQPPAHQRRPALLASRPLEVGPHDRRKDERGQTQGNQHDPEDPVPADQLAQPRGEKRRQHDAAVARGGHAHREALMRGRIGPTGQGQRHRKAGPCHAQQQPHAQDLPIGRRGEPAPQQGERLSDQEPRAGPLGPESIGAQADSDTEQRASK